MGACRLRMAAVMALLAFTAANARKEPKNVDTTVLSLRCWDYNAAMTNVCQTDEEITARYVSRIEGDPGRVDTEAVFIWKLPPLIPGSDFFVGNGSYDGGHAFFPSAAMARHGGNVFFVKYVWKGTDHETIFGFTGSRKHFGEKGDHQVDMDFTPLLVGRLAALRDSGSLDVPALIEFVNLLIHLRAANTDVTFLIPPGDIDTPAMMDAAAKRGWIANIGLWSQSGWNDPPVVMSGHTNKRVNRLSCAYSIGTSSVKLACTVLIRKPTEHSIDLVTFTSDYTTMKLVSKGVFWRARLIR